MGHTPEALVALAAKLAVQATGLHQKAVTVEQAVKRYAMRRRNWALFINALMEAPEVTDDER